MIVVRNGLMPFSPNLVRRWDILLPFLAYFGQHRTAVEGVILALFSGHLFSLCSGAPMGVFASYSLILLVVTRAVTYGVYAGTGISVFLFLAVLSLVSRATVAILSRLFGRGWEFWSIQNFNPLDILFNAMFAWIVYQALVLLDNLTFRAGGRMDYQGSGV